MEPRPTLSALTPEELLRRSREYRLMATSATSAEVRDGLNRLAVRFALLAARLEVAVFQKKSKHSIAMPRKEIELIRARLRWAEHLHAGKTEEG